MKLEWHRDQLEGYQAVSTAKSEKYSFIIFQKPGEWDYEIDIFPKGVSFNNIDERLYGLFLTKVSDCKKFAQGWEDSQFPDAEDRFLKFVDAVKISDVDVNKSI